jgi:hypothetical protein
VVTIFLFLYQFIYSARRKDRVGERNIPTDDGDSALPRRFSIKGVTSHLLLEVFLWEGAYEDDVIYWQEACFLIR